MAHALTLAHEDAAWPAVAPAGAVMPPGERLVDIAEMVGVSGPNDRGMPWIEYRGDPASEA